MNRRKLNTRFVAKFLAAITVLLGSSYFVHGYQVRRNANALLVQAELAEQEGRLQVAANYLGQFLGIRPKDGDGLARYGLLLANPKLLKSANDAIRAKMVLDRALYLDAGRHDVRRAAIRIDQELGLFGNAGEDIKRLLKVFPDDGELEAMLARCHEETSAFREARDKYESAIKHAPNRIETYVQFARLLRNHPKDVLRDKETEAIVCQFADKTVNSMVAANPSSYQAHLYRAEYLRLFLTATDHNAKSQMASDVARARELSPNAPDVLIFAASLAADRGDFEEARNLLKSGCEKNPDDQRTYASLARLETSRGQPDAAIAVLRNGLQKLKNDYELLRQLADVLTTEGRGDDATEVLISLQRIGYPEAHCNILRSRLALKAQKWRDAILLLEPSLATLTGRTESNSDMPTRELIHEAGVSLGACFERLGDYDRALAVYGRVVSREARSIPAALGQARMLEAMGRQGEAFDQYRHVATLPKPPPGVWFEIARLTLIRNLARDEKQRNWKEVESALKVAEDLYQPTPVEVVVLRAQALAARGELDAARSHLQQNYTEEAIRPVQAWIALASLAERQNRLEDAIAELDKAAQWHKNEVDLQLARARILIRQSPKSIATVLDGQAKQSNELSGEDWRRLHNGFAALAMHSGDAVTAGRLLQQLTSAYPDDLRYRLAQFDLATRSNDEEAIEKHIKQIRELEGDGGTMWRFCTAAAIVMRGARGEQADLAEARSLLRTVISRRNNWSRAELCLAQLDELDGKSDDALASYVRLIQRGERDPSVLRRAVELLQEKRRHAEAFELMGRLPEPDLLSSEFNRLGSMVAFSNNNAEAALKFAEAAVAKGSKDYRDHVWLGRVYWAEGQRAKALSAFKSARDMAPAEPAPWVVMIQFLAATGEKESAMMELEAAKKQLTGLAGSIALATCHQSVGQIDQAREIYVAAVAQHPDDANALRAIAEFYFTTGRLGEAVPFLRRLGVDLRAKYPGPSGWARQTLALALALQGDHTKSQEALQLLAAEEKGGPRGLNTGSVERKQAIILALKNSNRSRQAALRILEDLVERRLALPQDHFLAAQLYEQLKNWPQERRRYISLLGIPGAHTPAHMVAYARALLRNKELEEARTMVVQLEALDAKAGSVLELKARLFHADGKLPEAVKLLQEYAARNENQLIAVASLLNELGAHDAAEELYRRYGLKAGKPLNALVLAKYLLGRGKFAEALEICDRVWAEVPALTVAEIAIDVLSQADFNAKHFDRVERRLNESLQKTPNNEDLAVALANLRNFQGRYDDAERLYREVLKKNPQHCTALNNLAWIMAMRARNAGEALELVRRAADILGPDPGLLDTRAVVYLALKQNQATEMAIKDLEEVAAEVPSAASYFHLAQAYDAAGNRKEALSAWQKAKELKLAAGLLHPLERPTLERLARQFN